MVLHGVPRRYPNLRIILSHGGGFLPYSAYRVANIATVLDPSASYTDLISDLATFYFDTALASSPSSLPSLLQFARPGHVLYGSDWPYCLDRTVTFFTDALDRYEGLNAAGHAAINRQNAELLLPRLA